MSFLKQLSLKTVAITAILALIAFSTSYAQAPTVSLKHDVAKEIPPAGTPMNFVVELENTREARSSLRLYGVRDDRPFEITIDEAVFNKKDRPSYSFTFPAPEKEIRYQFFLFDPLATSDSSAQATNKAIRSTEYVLRRPCVPNAQLSEEELALINSGKVDSDNITALKVISKKLENEEEALKQAKLSLDEIFKLTGATKSAANNTKTAEQGGVK